MDKLIFAIVLIPFVICTLCLLTIGGLHLVGGYADLMGRLCDVMLGSFLVGTGLVMIAALGVAK